MLDIREFHDLNDRELTDAWLSLESSGACPNPFASHAWVKVWAGQFAPDATPSVFVGYEDGTPVARTPLRTRPDGTAELPINFLSLRGEFLRVLTSEILFRSNRKLRSFRSLIALHDHLF